MNFFQVILVQLQTDRRKLLGISGLNQWQICNLSRMISVGTSGIICFDIWLSHLLPEVQGRRLDSAKHIVEVIIIYVRWGKHSPFNLWSMGMSCNIHLYLKYWCLSLHTSISIVYYGSSVNIEALGRVCMAEQCYIRLHQIDSVFPVILSCENLASQHNKKTKPRKKTNGKHRAYVFNGNKIYLSVSI